jgi:hypothetical protein
MNYVEKSKKSGAPQQTSETLDSLRDQASQLLESFKKKNLVPLDKPTGPITTSDLVADFQKIRNEDRQRSKYSRANRQKQTGATDGEPQKKQQREHKQQQPQQQQQQAPPPSQPQQQQQQPPVTQMVDPSQPVFYPQQGYMPYPPQGYMPYPPHMPPQPVYYPQQNYYYYPQQPYGSTPPVDPSAASTSGNQSNGTQQQQQQ